MGEGSNLRWSPCHHEGPLEEWFLLMPRKPIEAAPKITPHNRRPLFGRSRNESTRLVSSHPSHPVQRVGEDPFFVVQIHEPARRPATRDIALKHR